MNITKAAACAIGALFIAFPVHAEQCSTIKNSANRLACYDRQAAGRQNSSNGNTVETSALPAQWVLRQSRDAMTDKKTCFMSLSDKPYVQISPGSIWISYRGRGGISSFRYRIDDEPASKLNLASNIEKKIGAVHIEGKEFQKILAAVDCGSKD